jgi:hypothetical protein
MPGVVLEVYTHSEAGTYTSGENEAFFYFKHSIVDIDRGTGITRGCSG